MLWESALFGVMNSMIIVVITAFGPSVAIQDTQSQSAICIDCNLVFV